MRNNVIQDKVNRVKGTIRNCLHLQADELLRQIVDEVPASISAQAWHQQIRPSSYLEFANFENQSCFRFCRGMTGWKILKGSIYIYIQIYRYRNSTGNSLIQNKLALTLEALMIQNKYAEDVASFYILIIQREVGWSCPMFSLHIWKHFKWGSLGNICP